MRQAVPSLIKEQEVLSIIKDKEPVQLAFLNKRFESIGYRLRLYLNGNCN